jgi:DNA-binding LytR/AlgR family response regulator
MNKINCLIVDDEELARNLVENYANRLTNLNVIGKCGSPLEAIQILQEQDVDLVFLDIQMPELTGIEFLNTLSHKPMVIFTTAYKEYALHGFDLDVVDYLLKPFRFERFIQAVNKASKILSKNNDQLITDSSSKTVLTEEVKNYVLVKSDFKVFRILFDEISHIESMKEYVAFHTPNGRKLSLGSLKKLQTELPENKFIRIHKSYIINADYIKSLEGNMIHIGDKKLPIGASFKEALLKRFF